MFYLAIVNKVLRHCHSWLARQYIKSTLLNKTKSSLRLVVQYYFLFVMPLVGQSSDQEAIYLLKKMFSVDSDI